MIFAAGAAGLNQYGDVEVEYRLRTEELEGQCIGSANYIFEQLMRAGMLGFSQAVNPGKSGLVPLLRKSKAGTDKANNIQ